MTSKGTLGNRLSQVDNLTRPDHHHLSADDVCLYLGEYTARKGYSFSDTNDLIINFKKKMERKGLPDWKYKEAAIARAGQLFKGAIKEEYLLKATHVPVPPSKIKSDPAHDNRVFRMIQIACGGLGADIRELVLQKQNATASHESDDRPSPESLLANYEINAAVAGKQPELIMVYDDVLTTGSHFKAVQKLLSTKYPGVQVLGLFIARRVPDTIEFDVIPDNDL